MVKVLLWCGLLTLKRFTLFYTLALLVHTLFYTVAPSVR